MIILGTRISAKASKQTITTCRKQFRIIYERIFSNTEYSMGNNMYEIKFSDSLIKINSFSLILFNYYWKWNEIGLGWLRADLEQGEIANSIVEQCPYVVYVF